MGNVLKNREQSSLNIGIFREYDIRGIVGEDFDSSLAYDLGLAYASMVLSAQVRRDNRNPSCSELGPLRVGVGYDCRLSTEPMKQELIRGLLDGGVDVLDCGMGPTPQLYFSVYNQKLDAGIQITASHNPGEYNGFKMMIGAKTLSGPDISRLRDAVLAGGLIQVSPEARGQEEFFNARQSYIEDLVERSKDFVSHERKLKIVVDAGNGVGGLVGPELLRRLGCEVIELFTEPDGRFPNHHPDPTVIENLKDLSLTVIKEGADAGIAWDGDADRIGVVDEHGNPIFGDMLLILFGRQLLCEVENPIIIGDVKCSDLLFDDLSSKGAQTVMAKTGHSLIKARLRELSAHLAGEMSGHMFFVHRYYGFDDALHASARLVEILSKAKQPLSELLSDLPIRVSTPELRVDCPESIKFEVAKKITQAFPEYEVGLIDGVRVRFAKGWGLVRASNTQPALVLRFEAEDALLLDEYRSLVEGRLREVIAEVSSS